MSHDPAVERLRELVRIPTISRADAAATDWTAFTEFRSALERHYPLVHAHLERELVAGHSLLYRWRGRVAGEPTVLMAHQDVVPATSDGWTHPPFDAVVTDDAHGRRLWGRGAIDDKGMLVAILEAVEGALSEGMTPRHDVYLAFGHDEEVGGTGAQDIVALLAKRGVRPALVLDEGGAIVEGVFPGIREQLAVIGVSEKGMTSVELAVEQQGGHASTPPPVTATMRLAAAILRVGRRRAPASLPEPTIRMLEALAPLASGGQALVFRHARRLQRPLVRVFDRLGPETAAMVRTTRAVTRLRGSEADNVLAERATAVVNLRIAVDSSLAEALRQLESAIDDPAVAMRVLEAGEPSPVSPSSGPAWARLTAAIADVAPDVVPIPYVQLGASDSRFFTAITDAVYRFSPFEITRPERDALHAIDERIGVQTWLDGIRVLRALLRSC